LTDAHLTGTHLTDEEFAGLLFKCAGPSVAEHLASCAVCAAEADRVSGAIGSFSQQSRLWAERRAASRPMQDYARPTVYSWLRIPRAAMACAAAALVIAAGAGIDLTHRGERAVAVQSVASSEPNPAITPATLKADNELLSAINGELDTAPSASAYGLAVSRHSSRTRPAKGITN
jgi:hypothetical protein